MRGKRGLIMGVTNNRSIAWGIAKAARTHGADLAFTYQGDALRKRVEPLAEEVDGLVVGLCSDDSAGGASLPRAGGLRCCELLPSMSEPGDDDGAGAGFDDAVGAMVLMESRGIA